MKAPIFIRALTPDEQKQIQVGLRSSSAFPLRRCQILRASERREHATAIAKPLGCDDQSVRNVIKGFNEGGLAVLNRASCRPHHLQTSVADQHLPALKALLHRSPRDFGLDRSLWSLPAVAKIAFSQGLLPASTPEASVRRALKRLGTNCGSEPSTGSPTPIHSTSEKKRT